MQYYYHGAHEINAKSILKSKVIERTNHKNSNYGIGNEYWKTTAGYVYLASTFKRAVDFAVRSVRCLIDKSECKYIYIFRVANSGDLQFYPDYDELEIRRLRTKKVTVEDSIRLVNTLSAKQDLMLGIHVTDYTILPLDNETRKATEQDNPIWIRI